MPCWRTIYRWIFVKYPASGNLKVLRRKGKSHSTKKREVNTARESRFASGDSRQEAGHRETDTVIRRPGQEQGLVLPPLQNAGRTFVLQLKSPTEERDKRNRHCFRAFRLSFPAGSDHNL